MEHTTKDGFPKILPACEFPLTSVRSVNKVITDLGVIEFRNNQAHLVEIAPHSSREEVQAKTGIPLFISA